MQSSHPSGLHCYWCKAWQNGFRVVNNRAVTSTTKTQVSPSQQTTNSYVQAIDTKRVRRYMITPSSELCVVDMLLKTLELTFSLVPSISWVKGQINLTFKKCRNPTTERRGTRIDQLDTLRYNALQCAVCNRAPRGRQTITGPKWTVRPSPAVSAPCGASWSEIASLITKW
jgi:hypothetical protein